MTDSAKLARRTRVEDCQKLLEIEPLVVGLEVDLLAALRQAAAQPATHLMGVVDDAGRLVGVLPVRRLCEAVVARVVPESLLADITGAADVADFGLAVEARTVAGVMTDPASISGDATVGEAFHLMHHRRLPGVYVVDAAGRPTGYLDLLELAVSYVDALEAEDHPDRTPRGAALEPPDRPR